LEVDGSLIERWLRIPEHVATLAEESGKIDPAVIRAETRRSIGPLQELSRETFSRWIDRFEIAPRKRALPSR
jgi:hypothetical protein